MNTVNFPHKWLYQFMLPDNIWECMRYFMISTSTFALQTWGILLTWQVCGMVGTCHSRDANQDTHIPCWNLPAFWFLAFLPTAVSWQCVPGEVPPPRLKWLGSCQPCRKSRLSLQLLFPAWIRPCFGGNLGSGNSIRKSWHFTRGKKKKTNWCSTYLPPSLAPQP